MDAGFKVTPKSILFRYNVKLSYMHMLHRPRDCLGSWCC